MSTKPGVPFGEIANKVQTFDLFLFRGGDFVSGAIADVEEACVGVRDFTHAGIAIRAKDFYMTSPLWRPGDDTLYVFESTASGKFVDGVNSVVDNKGHLGVQLRDMARVVDHYDNSPTTRMAWMPLQDSVRAHIDVRIANVVVEKYMRTSYDASCVNLVAAASPFARKIRDSRLFRKIRSALCKYCCCGSQPDTWLFCSELCAQIYKDIGVFPDSVVSADVMPVDFMPEEKAPLLAEGSSSPSSSSSSSSSPKMTTAYTGKTVDADHQVPWIFKNVIRFHANYYPSRAS